MLDGFNLAHDRFTERVTSHAPDAPDAIYRALFETLAWTASLASQPTGKGRGSARRGDSHLASDQLRSLLTRAPTGA